MWLARNAVHMWRRAWDPHLNDTFVSIRPKMYLVQFAADWCSWQFIAIWPSTMSQYACQAQTNYR